MRASQSPSSRASTARSACACSHGRSARCATASSRRALAARSRGWPTPCTSTGVDQQRSSWQGVTAKAEEWATEETQEEETGEMEEAARRGRTMAPGAIGVRTRRSADIDRGDQGDRGDWQIRRRSTPRPMGRWRRLLRRQEGRIGTPSRRLLAPPHFGCLADHGGCLRGCQTSFLGGVRPRSQGVSPSDLVRASPQLATNPMESREPTRRPQICQLCLRYRVQLDCAEFDV